MPEDMFSHGAAKIGIHKPTKRHIRAYAWCTKTCIRAYVWCAKTYIQAYRWCVKTCIQAYMWCAKTCIRAYVLCANSWIRAYAWCRTRVFENMRENICPSICVMPNTRIWEYARKRTSEHVRDAINCVFEHVRNARERCIWACAKCAGKDVFVHMRMLGKGICERKDKYAEKSVFDHTQNAQGKVYSSRCEMHGKICIRVSQIALLQQRHPN